jgi:hypothetical protein
MEPPCPSGRPNHDCVYLENLGDYSSSEPPSPCRDCAIRKYGLAALKAGVAFYIMTSARDILLDVFAPAREKGRFDSGLFTLCRYSMRPFAVGMLTSGIRGVMIPFESGDCRDYATWLRADEGYKDERTEIEKSNHALIAQILGDRAVTNASSSAFERRGNVLFPRAGVAAQSGESVSSRNDEPAGAGSHSPLPVI